MKVFVLFDARGDVESVAVPNPTFSDSLTLAAPPGGSVHLLEVDSRVITREQLLDPASAAARRKVYDKLREMIARTPTSTRQGRSRRTTRR